MPRCGDRLPLELHHTFTPFVCRLQRWKGLFDKPRHAAAEHGGGGGNPFVYMPGLHVDMGLELQQMLGDMEADMVSGVSFLPQCTALVFQVAVSKSRPVCRTRAALRVICHLGSNMRGATPACPAAHMKGRVGFVLSGHGYDAPPPERAAPAPPACRCPAPATADAHAARRCDIHACISYR